MKMDLKMKKTIEIKADIYDETLCADIGKETVRIAYDEKLLIDTPEHLDDFIDFLIECRSQLQTLNNEDFIEDNKEVFGGANNG